MSPVRNLCLHRMHAPLLQYLPLLKVKLSELYDICLRTVLSMCKSSAQNVRNVKNPGQECQP